MGHVTIMHADATYEEFCEELMTVANSKECRYAIFDFEFTGPEIPMVEKIVFFLWSALVFPHGVKMKHLICHFISFCLSTFTPSLAELRMQGELKRYPCS